jgi:hypothetical protein
LVYFKETHMRKCYSIPLSTTLGIAASLPVAAGELAIKVQLPEINTGEYLRPYLAIWVEKADDTFVETLSLWHMLKGKRGQELPQGDRYLNTLRSWWKQSGTSSQMPIDGISSPTRAPGEHELVFTEGKVPFNKLAPGKYQLVFEVSREIKGPPPIGPDGLPLAMGAGMAAGMGGASKDALEELRLDFEWPVKKSTQIQAKGQKELGNVTLLLTP